VLKDCTPERVGSADGAVDRVVDEVVDRVVDWVADGDVDGCSLEVEADVVGVAVTSGRGGVAVGAGPAAVTEPSGAGAPSNEAAAPARAIAPQDSPAVTLTTSSQVAAYRSRCLRDPLIGSSPCCA